MKKLGLMMLCCIYCIGVMSQQDSAFRDFKLIVAEKKGNNNVSAFFISHDVQVPLSKIGAITFSHVLPEDTLVVMVNKKHYFIQSKGLDSIYLEINKNKVTAYKDHPSGKKADIRTAPPSSLKMDDLDGFTNLAEYMQGRIAGVSVVRNGNSYTVYIRGARSLLFDDSALVIVNGTVVDSFDTANRTIGVRDIKSVEVIKDGAGYGSRGANGVIVITTK